MNGKDWNKNKHWTLDVLGRTVNISVYDTQKGLSFLIEGGDLGHIGAVAAAEAGKVLCSFSFPEHREAVVCEHWAEKISAVYPGPVIVQAGIHFDDITKEQIWEAVAALDGEADRVSALYASPS